MKKKCKNKYKYHANQKTKRQTKPPKKQKPQKRDLTVQFQNLVDNGGLAHKYITEQEALFLGSVNFNCSIQSLTQGQILSVIRHKAFYNYQRTADAIRSPELKKKYHKIVNDMIFKTYPWLDKYKYEKEVKV